MATKKSKKSSRASSRRQATFSELLTTPTQLTFCLAAMFMTLALVFMIMAYIRYY